MVLYSSLSLNRLIVIVVLCSSCLQGCQFILQVTSEEPVCKKLRKTSNDVQVMDQTSVLSVPSAARSDVPNDRLPVAIPPATLPLVATSAVQVASPTCHLAVMPCTLSSWKRVSSMDPKKEDMKPAARPPAQGAKFSSSAGRLVSLHASPFQVSMAFGAGEWGEVATAPFLPSDVAEILNSPEIREESASVLRRQSEVLSLTQVLDAAERARLLASFKEELLASLREEREKYEKLLLQHQASQGQLELGQKEGMTHLVEKQAPPLQLVMPAETFGAREWRKYFGGVEEVPPLPLDIADILGGPCPFWPGKVVKDTHLLVLIPVSVAGKPFSLNLLGDLIKRSKGGGYSTKYRGYDSDVREQFGSQLPVRSYWVLMTRDVLEGSRGKDYKSQKALIAHHASRTGLPYELPGILEAATVILSHYVRSGERLYADDPWTFTRCQELSDNLYPTAVGGFSSGGLLVLCGHSNDNNCRGVACLRKF
jgi:hypothetical protein